MQEVVNLLWGTQFSDRLAGAALCTGSPSRCKLTRAFCASPHPPLRGVYSRSPFGCRGSKPLRSHSGTVPGNVRFTRRPIASQTFCYLRIAVQLASPPAGKGGLEFCTFGAVQLVLASKLCYTS